MITGGVTMEKHKLDEATEEILQHYGIKGMKWDVIRTDEQIAAAQGKATANEAAGGGGSDEDGLFEELGEALSEITENITETLDDIGDSVKKQGMAMLTSIFGKSKPTLKKAKPNAKLTEKFKQNVKDGTPNRMAAKANSELSKMSKTEQREAKKPVRREYKTTKGPASKTREVTTTRKGIFGLPVKSTQSTKSSVTSYEPKKKNK